MSVAPQHPKRVSSPSKRSPAKRAKISQHEVRAVNDVKDDEKQVTSGESGITLDQAIEATKDILALLNPDSSDALTRDIPPLHLHGLRTSFLSLVESSRKRRTSMSSARNDPVEVDWGMFKNWPEGLLEEEEAMREYLNRLEMVLIEQETKMGFLRNCDDTKPSGMVLWSASDVAKGETQVRRLLTQLEARRTSHAALRSSIDNLTTALEAPHAKLETDTAEAATLISSIADMELELARLRAKGGGAAADDEGALPKKGTLTSAEAGEYCDQQQTDMATMDAQLAELRTAVKSTKESFAHSQRACDRLSTERAAWERKAKAAQEEEEISESAEQGGRAKPPTKGRARDRALEKECNTHTATLSLLHSLLGITSISAPSPRQILARYATSSEAGEAAEPFDLLLTFDEPGGKIIEYSILDTSNTYLSDTTEVHRHKEHVRAPGPHTSACARLQAAMQANDAPLLVMEALAAMAAPVAAA